MDIFDRYLLDYWGKFLDSFGEAGGKRIILLVKYMSGIIHDRINRLK